MRKTFGIALVLTVASAALARAQSAARVDELLARDSIAAAARAAADLFDAGTLTPAQRAAMGALFGRFDAVDGAPSALDAAPGTTGALVRLAAGVVPSDLDALDAALAGGGTRAVLGRASAERAVTILGYALRGSGPGLVATTNDPDIMLLVCEAARDSLCVRQSATALEAARHRLARRNVPPPLALAEALLWLGDSTAALNTLVAFDGDWTAMARDVEWSGVANGWLLGRTWLLEGDVASALGRRDVAVHAYRRVVDLWANGGPDVQGALARARAALADADAVRPAPANAKSAGTPGRYDFRPMAAAPSRWRYDAAMWARLPFAGRADTARALARLTVVATERPEGSAAGGLAVSQRYDAVQVDLPAAALVGLDDLQLRMQVRDAARDLTAESALDASGHLVRRTVHAGAPLPAELRGALEDGDAFAPLAVVARLPARAVRIGDTWRDSIRLWVPGGLFDPGTRVEADYRLDRVSEAGGARLAFVSVHASLRGTVRAHLDGEFVYDLASGAYVRMAASLYADVGPAGGATRVRVLLTALRLPMPAGGQVATGTPAVSAATVAPD